MPLREICDDEGVPPIVWEQLPNLVRAYAEVSPWCRELILSNHDHQSHENPAWHQVYLLERMERRTEDEREDYMHAVCALAKKLQSKTWSKKYLKDSAVPMYKNMFLVTLTKRPEWTDVEAKAKIDKFRKARFKMYKHVWVEEHGTTSGAYHQHVLVQTNGQKMHTGQNLKKTKEYDANIRVDDVIANKQNVKNTYTYMQKENPTQGDNDFFKSLIA